MDKIVKHVTSKSEIKDCDLFSVELMVKAKEKVQKLSFVSFKITTCSKNVFDAIMNEELWAPNFTAVEFSHRIENAANGTTNNNKTNNYNGINSNHSQVKTPAKPNQSRVNERNDAKNKPSNRHHNVAFNGNARSSQSSHSTSTTTTKISPKTPGKKAASTESAQGQLNGLQMPGFFGIPGLAPNPMYPLFYPMHQQHVQHVQHVQQPILSQLPIQQEQQQRHQYQYQPQQQLQQQQMRQ